MSIYLFFIFLIQLNKFFDNNLKLKIHKNSTFQKIEHKNFFSCPTCRKIFLLDSQETQSFSRNNVLVSVIKELKKVVVRFNQLLNKPKNSTAYQ